MPALGEMPLLPLSRLKLRSDDAAERCSDCGRGDHGASTAVDGLCGNDASPAATLSSLAESRGVVGRGEMGGWGLSG